MSYKHLAIVVSLTSLCFFLYGIIFLILEVEKNSCRMTYMFEYPQFVRVHFKANNKFPKYGLYAYSEGGLTEKARSMKFNGAPVIFVPGNSGSYKQARSFASVAIRKGLDNNWNHHLDYFTIDYNEEYSALFGGYLENQKQFLTESINAVLNLYRTLPNAPDQVVLIGHSMGAKIAESVLTDPEIASRVNTIISLAGPIDRPVANVDFYFEAFYRKIDEYLSEQRSRIHMKNDTNYCVRSQGKAYQKEENAALALDDKLLITIGGGNRDLLVHGGLTHSKYSDIHAMTSSIPNVWLTTDHLCTVWCLQLVLVVNRFLYSIISTNNAKNSHKMGQSFIEDKSVRMSKALHYFVKPYVNLKNNEITLAPDSGAIGDWVEDSRRVYSLEYNYGINQTLHQMVRLTEAEQYKILSVEAVNLDSDDWVFGCAANDVNKNMRYCTKAFSLSHHVRKMPSVDQKRLVLNLNLHKLKKTHPAWTHVLLKIAPTSEKVKLNIDINNGRILDVKMPKWYSYRTQSLLEDSVPGSSNYKITINELDESYQSLEFNIKPRVCSKDTHHAVAKVCVPWARGFERYQHFTHEENNPLYVNVPITRPSQYNSTVNPVTIELQLDPSCRYTISYRNSFGGSLSRIVHQYFHWLPAHLTAILLLSFKYQISITPKMTMFKCGKLHAALIHCSSFFIITATRIFAKFLQNLKFLPEPDNFRSSMIISFIIHGSALAILMVATAALWLCICFNGSLAHKLFLRLTKVPVPSFSFLMPLFEKIPLTAGVVLTSIAFGSCGGLALICSCCIYFMLMSKQYEDYLEQFVFKTAKLIASKLFGRKEKPTVEENNENEGISEDTTEEEISSTEEDKDKDVVANETEGHENDNEEKSLVVAEENQQPAVATTEEDAELEKLLKEAIEKQKEAMEEKRQKKLAERKEYDDVHKGLSNLHFHMTLFMLLCVLTLLNLPATVSWAKNFQYSRNLQPDPSLIPTVTVLACLSFLWQFETPRNVFAYEFVSSVLYVCAAICVLYCQDSVYRLNGVISAIFVLVTLHQFFSPKKQEQAEEDVVVDKELQDRIDKMEALLADAEQKERAASEAN